MSIVPIFSEILRSFVEEGRFTDKMRKWCVVELLELNTSILGAFEQYIRMSKFSIIQNMLISLLILFQLLLNCKIAKSNSIKTTSNGYKMYYKLCQSMTKLECQFSVCIQITFMQFANFSTSMVMLMNYLIISI